MDGMCPWLLGLRLLLEPNKGIHRNEAFAGVHINAEAMTWKLHFTELTEEGGVDTDDTDGDTNTHGGGTRGILPG